MLEKLPQVLPPPHIEIDHAIELYPRSQPVSIPPFKMSFKEAKELQIQLTELIELGFIIPTKSPFGALQEKYNLSYSNSAHLGWE